MRNEHLIIIFIFFWFISTLTLQFNPELLGCLIYECTDTSNPLKDTPRPPEKEQAFSTIKELEPKTEQEAHTDSTTHAASSALIYSSIALAFISLTICVIVYKKRQQNFVEVE